MAAEAVAPPVVVMALVVLVALVSAERLTQAGTEAVAAHRAAVIEAAQIPAPTGKKESKNPKSDCQMHHALNMRAACCKRACTSMKKCCAHRGERAVVATTGNQE
jgi:hypothetical protein